LDVPAIENYLIEQGAGAEQAQFISHLSNGRPGYASRLLEDMAALEARADRLGDLQTLLGSTRVAKFKYAEALAKDRAATQQTLLIWLSYWRDVLLTITGASAPLTNIDLSDQIESVSSRLHLAEVRCVISRLETALEQLESNVNPRLLLEVLLLNLPEVDNVSHP
jgi:DNA polymerase-3 subunit delta'